MLVDFARAKRLAMAISIFAALVAPATALGAPPAASGAESALSLYRESTKAYNEGRFQDAIDLLSRAYALAKQPVLLFNLARAYEGLGDLPKAIESYKGYLESDPNTTDRGSIEQRIETLQKQLDERAALEQQRDDERRKAEVAQRAEREARKSDQEGARRHPSALPWVLAGVGVAGVTAGVVFGVLSHDQYTDSVAAPYIGPARNDYGNATNYATYANIAFVSGGILTAAGVAWGLLDLRASRLAADGSAAPGGMRLIAGIGSIGLWQSF
jgi:tetratricopeptide (TPR) repeat protein